MLFQLFLSVVLPRLRLALVVLYVLLQRFSGSVRLRDKWEHAGRGDCKSQQSQAQSVDEERECCRQIRRRVAVSVSELDARREYQLRCLLQALCGLLELAGLLLYSCLRRVKIE